MVQRRNYFQLNDNENVTCQNQSATVWAVFREKFIALKDISENQKTWKLIT